MAARRKIGPNLVQEGEGGPIYLKIFRKGRGEITRATGTSDLQEALKRREEILAAWDSEYQDQERKLNAAEKAKAKEVEWKPVFSQDGDRIKNLYLRSRGGIYYVRKSINGRNLMQSTHTKDLKEAISYLERILPAWLKSNGADTCPHCGKFI